MKSNQSCILPPSKIGIFKPLARTARRACPAGERERRLEVRRGPAEGTSGKSKWDSYDLAVRGCVAFRVVITELSFNPLYNRVCIKFRSSWGKKLFQMSQVIQALARAAPLGQLIRIKCADRSINSTTREWGHLYRSASSAANPRLQIRAQEAVILVILPPLVFIPRVHKWIEFERILGRI